jgi:hypothetical protein
MGLDVWGVRDRSPGHHDERPLVVQTTSGGTGQDTTAELSFTSWRWPRGLLTTWRQQRSADLLRHVAKPMRCQSGGATLWRGPSRSRPSSGVTLGPDQRPHVHLSSAALRSALS